MNGCNMNDVMSEYDCYIKHFALWAKSDGFLQFLHSRKHLDSDTGSEQNNEHSGCNWNEPCKVGYMRANQSLKFPFIISVLRVIHYKSNYITLIYYFLL